MSTLSEAETLVIWDMEECKIPNDLDIQLVYKNIKSALANEGYLGNVLIHAYGKKNKIGDDILPEGFTFIIHEREIGLRDSRIFDDALWSKQRNLMIIANENALISRKGRNRDNILLAQNVINPSVVRTLAATSVWYWKSLSSGGKPLPIDLNATARPDKT